MNKHRYEGESSQADNEEMDTNHLTEENDTFTDDIPEKFPPASASKRGRGRGAGTGGRGRGRGRGRGASNAAPTSSFGEGRGGGTMGRIGIIRF